MCKRNKWLLWCLLFSVTIFIGRIEQAQSQEKYPTKAIDIIVPFSPGGGVDLECRIVGSYLNRKWGVPVNVINKAGGNTVPANLEVYSSKPDGYTVFGDSLPSSSMLGVVVKNLPFKVLDRTVVAIFAYAQSLLVVPSTSPYKTLDDVIAAVKKDPGNFTWTSLGGASSADYGVRQFFKAIGVDISKTKPVMAQGGAPAIGLVAGGHVILGCNTTSSVLPSFQAGMVRALGITGKNRHPSYPNVPTFEEIGYPDIDVAMWYGISGPPKLPSNIIERWDAALREMLREPEIVSQIDKVGGIPLYLNSADAKKRITKEVEEVDKLWGLK